MSIVQNEKYILRTSYQPFPKYQDSPSVGKNCAVLYRNTCRQGPCSPGLTIKEPPTTPTQWWSTKWKWSETKLVSGHKRRKDLQRQKLSNEILRRHWIFPQMNCREGRGQWVGRMKWSWRESPWQSIVNRWAWKEGGREGQSWEGKVKLDSSLKVKRHVCTCGTWTLSYRQQECI